MVCLPLSINLSARHQAYSQDDIVALGLASGGQMDLSLWPDASCSSPKKRQRSNLEQANDLSELCVTPLGCQPGRHSVGGHTATACSLQRDRPIARSSWPSILRLNSCSMREQPSSCNSSMCSSQTSSMTPSCSSPTSQTSSMAPYSNSSCYDHGSSSSVTHSSASVMSACAALSESSSNSCWSSSAGLISRRGPGHVIAEGVGWIIPQYGGREALAEYEFGPTLGCGTFGITRLVTHRLTGRPSACKTICKATLASSPAAISDVQHEVAILQHLSGHSGIVQLQGVYEDERNIHLVMELCTGGDLLDYISRFGRLAETEAADVAHVMLKTLQHCHKLGVVHRDIKPENFLLGAPTMLLSPAGSAAAALKISDFGVSAFLHPGESFSEIVGTPFYMAPEVLERNYGPAADVWSVGVVVFLMIAGCLPFNGTTDRQIIKAVLDSDPDFSSIAWQGVSAEAKHFVQQILVKDPSKRASIQQLLKHPWLGGKSSNSQCSRSSSHCCDQVLAAASPAEVGQQDRNGEAAARRGRDNRAISCPGKWWSAGAPTVTISSSSNSSNSSSYPGCLPCEDQLGSTSPPATPPLVSHPPARQTSVRSRFQSGPGSSP